MTEPPAEAVDRFRRDVETLLAQALDGAVPHAATRYALAVSGGPDSMAMLLLAAAAFPGRVIAATFDHRLRDGSAGEAAMVADVCANLGVGHAMLVPDTPITGASVQSNARVARYAALTGWAVGEDVHPLLTAHHADDQAETLLMRLARASGVAGLRAIRPYRFSGGALILRPLLGWRRAALRATVEQAGVRFVDDPSNTDRRYDRTRFRALLAATPDLDASALAMSARFIGEADEALAHIAEITWSERWHGPDRPFAIDDLPRDTCRRLLRRAIAYTREAKTIVLPAFGDSANVEPLLDALEARGSAVQGGVLVRWTAHGLLFSPAPPRRSH